MSTKTEQAIKTTLNRSYKVIVKSIHPRGRWGRSEISIYATGGVFKRKLGGYTRNYPAHGLSTWYPFSRGEKDYALYSPEYTYTRVMELSSFKDIGGEDPDPDGFCPVEYLVPEIRHFEKEPDPEGKAPYVYSLKKTPSDVAFVAGCFWGDDSSWKIQCFDISRIESGIIKRDERFGHVAIPKGVTLKDSVSLERDEDTGAAVVTLPVMQTFDLKSGEHVTVDPFR
ncbi:MAG TPA: hypothetical protein VI488_12600 [Candidatus Angelobacter sp.]